MPIRALRDEDAVMSFEEIGAKLGISRQYAKVLYESGIRKLRNEIAAGGIEFIDYMYSLLDHDPLVGHIERTTGSVIAETSDRLNIELNDREEMAVFLDQDAGCPIANTIANEAAL